MVPVLIPTYKGETRISKVLTCVEEQDEKTMIFLRDNNTNGVYYTKAINEGLQLYAFNRDVEFCLVLCDDVYLEPGCLTSLLETAKKYPNAGIISPIQIDSERKVTWAGSAYSYPVGAHFKGILDQKPYPTPWPSGAVFLVRTALVKIIGVMDDNMRFICSDADYGFRARAAGFHCVVDPRAMAEHTFNGSAKTDDPELARIKNEDLLYFSRKWVSGGLFRKLEAGGGRCDRCEVLENEMKLMESLNRG